jgi:hypothetical protein
MDISNWAAVATTILTLVATLTALGASFLSIAARDWSAPSQADWLRHDLFADPVQLRRYWMVSMLETHTSHAATNRRKAGCVVVAQWALVIAGLGAASMAIVQLVLGLHG